jgi:transposase InsO family protein
VGHPALKPVLDREVVEERVVERIRAIQGDHPFWGYRRVWAWLVHRDKIPINKKRVYRLMKEAGLLLKTPIHRACRTPRAKPKATHARQFWGIDMTKFMIPILGWVYLVIVLDWYTKKIVGWDLSLRSRRQEWQAALDRGLMAEFPNGVRDQGLKLISDNGCQPTATGFMAACATVGVEQIFTSYNNPKGNAETERMMRTIKEELLWLNEFGSLEAAREAIRVWVEQGYNRDYVHSALGYRSPLEFESDMKREVTLAA